MNKFGKLLVTAALLLPLITVSGVSWAATLDFTEVPVGTYTAPVLLSNATLTSDDGDILIIPSSSFFQDTNGKGSFCGSPTVGGGCPSSFTISFNQLINDLSFDIGGYGLGDQIEIFAYNGTNLLGNTVFTENTRVDFSALGNLDRIYVLDSSTNAGFHYNDFNFVNVSVVPLPAAFPIFASGLLGLGGIRRLRRRRATNGAG